MECRQRAHGRGHDFGATGQRRVVHRLYKGGTDFGTAVRGCVQARVGHERPQLTQVHRAGAQPDTEALLDVLDVRQRLGGDDLRGVLRQLVRGTDDVQQIASALEKQGQPIELCKPGRDEAHVFNAGGREPTSQLLARRFALAASRKPQSGGLH